MSKRAKIVDYGYSYKMAYDVPMFEELCVLHVCFLLTVCITPNSKPFDTTLHNSK